MQLAQARNEFYASNQDNEAQALSNLLNAWKAKKLNGKVFCKSSTGFAMPCQSKVNDESMVNGMKRFNWNEQQKALLYCEYKGASFLVVR